MKGLKYFGTALNEASVQLMTSKIMENENDLVTYYNITFPTNSPNYYPLECNLVTQLAYVTGEYSLFESTILSNNTFKDKFISQTSTKAYYEIIKSLDTLMELQENLIKLTNNLNTNNSKLSLINKKIDMCKLNITEAFLKTQNLILCSYFDKAYEKISTFEDLENYRRKLYNYKSLIGITDGYNFFNSYYIEKMNLLEKKYNYLEIYGENIFPIVSKSKKTINLFKKIKNMLYAIKN